MAERHDPLREVLDGYAKFLRKEDLALAKHQPYLVRWVREFLAFAREHPGYTFEQTLDLFLAGVGGRVGTKPWQLQQASDAIRIYRYQYRGASDDGRGGGPAAGVNDDAAILVRLREVIRLRHYARSTEKTYLHWNRRFLAYRHETGSKGQPNATDAKAFLTHLAMVEKVSASTQNQAFSALLLLFREVLRVDLEEMAQTVRANVGSPVAPVGVGSCVSHLRSGTAWRCMGGFSMRSRGTRWGRSYRASEVSHRPA